MEPGYRLGYCSTQRGNLLKRVIKDDVAQCSGMSCMFYVLSGKTRLNKSICQAGHYALTSMQYILKSKNVTALI